MGGAGGMEGWRFEAMRLSQNPLPIVVEGQRLLFIAVLPRVAVFVGAGR